MIGKPVITAVPNFSMTEDVSASISLSQITYTDIDSPASGLEVVAIDGDQYSVSGNRIIPDPNYNGPLTVSVKLKDGDDESTIFKFTVQVLAVNDRPVVLSADKTIKCSKGSPLLLTVSLFEISDPDNTQFTIIPLAGEGYDIISGMIVPHSENEEMLNVAIVASDGLALSQPFTFEIHVLPAMVTGIERKSKINIWPNPAMHIVDHEFDSAFEVRIMDQSGRVVAKDETRAGIIDISQLAPGIYFIEGQDDQQEIKRYKLVKQ